MTGLPILSVITLAPLLGALLVGLLGKDVRVPRYVALAASLVSVAGSVWVYFGYDRAAGGFQFVEHLRWIPSIGASYTLGVDGLSAPMLLLTSVLILASTLVSWDVAERPKEFFVLLLLLVTGMFGVFAALDAFLLFFFYEMAVLPKYLLIAGWGSTRKEYSAMKLTLFVFAGSALLIVVLVATYWAAGASTFDMRVWAQHGFAADFQRWIFLFAVLGFGTLVPIVPLHTWLPDGHVAAPTAVSMMLAGVMLKIGAYGLIRLGLTMFPLGWNDWQLLLVVLGLINVVYGAFSALGQSDLKFVIAYSSVSHMGYVLLGMGVGDKFGLAGAGYQMFAHGVMTALFFALIGYVYEQTHTREISEISGLMRKAPLVAACFVIAGASSMGLPSTAGFIAELLVYVGLVMRSPWIAAVAFLGVIATATYVLRILSRIVLGEPSASVEGMLDARPIRFAPFAILAFTIMAAGMVPGSLYNTIVTGMSGIVTKLAGW
jgi:NADH-quinone oxidoreductase subunit M